MKENGLGWSTVQKWKFGYKKSKALWVIEILQHNPWLLCNVVSAYFKMLQQL